MPNLNSAVRAWASGSDFRYLVDPELIGWLWPAEHSRLVAKLKRDHPEKAALIIPHILPPVPLSSGDELHPDFVSDRSAEITF